MSNVSEFDFVPCTDPDSPLFVKEGSEFMQDHVQKLMSQMEEGVASAKKPTCKPMATSTSWDEGLGDSMVFLDDLNETIEMNAGTSLDSSWNASTATSTATTFNFDAFPPKVDMKTVSHDSGCSENEFDNDFCMQLFADLQQDEPAVPCSVQGGGEQAQRQQQQLHMPMPMPMPPHLLQPSSPPPRRAAISKSFTTIEPLAAKDAKDSRTHDKNGEKIKRPLNAYMLWLKDFRKKDILPTAGTRGISGLEHEAKKCKSLGAVWKGLEETEKAHWTKEAEKAKEDHKRAYPNYKYTPKSPKGAKKQQRLVAKRSSLTALNLNGLTLSGSSSFSRTGMDFSRPSSPARKAAPKGRKSRPRALSFSASIAPQSRSAPTILINPLHGLLDGVELPPLTPMLEGIGKDISFADMPWADGIMNDDFMALLAC
jgi:hypothetical protein